LFCSLSVRWLYPLTAALIVFGFLSARAQTAGDHWTVSTVDGAAMLTGDGGEGYAASPGQPVTAGTTIMTEDDGTVVLVRRGDSVTVYPNSEMTIPAGSGAGEPGILQDIGKLLFRMETRESRDFEVRTPFLAATIKGTTFTVVVEPTRATVSVAEGLVRVEAARGMDSAMVGAGKEATVSNDDGDSIFVTAVGPGTTGRPVEWSGNFADGDSQGGSFQGGDSQDSGFQGGDSQGSSFQGSDSQDSGFQGGDSQGSGSRGGDSQGSSFQGGDSQGSGSQDGSSQGNQQ
jgi:hypothetical protein